MAPPLPDLVLYARPGCDLCDEARTAIALVFAERGRAGRAVPNLVERNIEADEALHRTFLELIPVVELGDRRIELAVSAGKIQRLLAVVLDSESEAAAPASQARNESA